MPPKSLEEDLIAYLDNELDEVGIQRVEQALTEDATLRGLLSMLLRQRTILAQIHAKKREETEQIKRSETKSTDPKTVRTTKVQRSTTRTQKPTARVQRSTKRKQQNQTAWFAAAAALLALVGYTIYAAQTEQTAENEDIIAKIEYKEDLPILGKPIGEIIFAQERMEGDQLAAGEQISLQEGASIQLTYPDGSIISLSKQASIVAHNGKRLDIKQGHLSASVKKQDAGQTLSVSSIYGRVQVVGTSFTVTVAEERMHTEVREGQVKVMHHEKPGEYLLTANEEIVLDEIYISQFLTATVSEILAEGREGFIEFETEDGIKRFRPPWKDENVLRQLRRYREFEGKRLTIRWTDDGEHLRVLEIVD